MDRAGDGVCRSRTAQGRSPRQPPLTRDRRCSVPERTAGDPHPRSLNGDGPWPCALARPVTDCGSVQPHPACVTGSPACQMQ